MLFFRPYGIYLRVMIRLTKFLLISLFPFCISAQSNTFRSSLDKYSPDSFMRKANNADTNQYLNIDPRIFILSSLSNKDKTYNTYLLGLNFKSNIKNKLITVGSYDYLDGNQNPLIRNYQDSLAIYYPGFGVDNNRFQFNTKYLANNFITVDIGYGKQFIGDGEESLLLSDVASSYPYLKLTTGFGPVRYYNLYTTFLNPNMIDYGRKKHATIHYLDFSITSRVSFGVFESVLWQSKSEEEYNGYELAYLNPVIFYRPVEFSKKSSKGNTLMGVNFNASLKKITFYGQFMLDDLNISRQRDKDKDYGKGFFQNKYAFQLGLKGQSGDNIDYLIEYNQVQPYTYGHRTILQNYSHMNQALAHPLGGNFKELINTLQIRKGDWTYKIKAMIVNVGLDSISTHYGQNIFESDYQASSGGQHSYGNFNGQGVSTTILFVQPEVSFSLREFDIFASIYYREKKSDLIDQTLIFYSLGVRTFPFSFFDIY